MKGINKKQEDILRKDYPRLADVMDAIDKLSPIELKMFGIAMKRSLARSEDNVSKFLLSLPPDRMHKA